MSEEIDMRSYAGEVMDSAAEGQQIVHDNMERMHEEAIGSVERHQAPAAQEPIEQQSRQELNFRALSGEVERLKAERESERREYNLQLELIKANSQRQPEVQPQRDRRMFEGKEDNDIPTIAELRQEWSDRETVYQRQLSQYQGNIEEMQVALNNPDYAEVLQKYSAPLLKNDPILAQGVNGAENKAMYVYRLGKMAQQMEATRQTSQQAVNPTAQRIVDNAKKPGNLGSAGGQSALSKADYFAGMSDKEFMEYASKNLD